MKLPSIINSRTLSAAVLSVGLVSAFSFTARADQWDKKTILTVNERIQVQDKVLEPGQYVFKLLNSNSDRHVVQIFNRDESHIIDTVLAIPEYRMEPTGKSQFKFYETPSGYVKALHAWYYPGDNFGQGFTYPKHLEMLAMASLAPQAPMVTQQTQTEEAVTPPPAPEPALETPAPPTEIAQNTPPPAAETTAPEPAPANTLPKTASPYPLVGLAGLVFIGAFSLFRLKRSA